MKDFKDISDLNAFIESGELDLDNLEGAAGGACLDDCTPEEREEYKALWDEFNRLAELARADKSYVDACNNQFMKIGLFCA